MYEPLHVPLTAVTSVFKGFGMLALAALICKDNVTVFEINKAAAHA